MRPLLLLVLNTITLVFALFLNYYGSSGALTGKTVGEVSDQYSTLITPAPFAFSIWGLIYLLLIGFVAFQWYSWIKEKRSDEIESTGPWLSLANLINGLWIVVWVNEMPGVSVLLMLVLLFALIMLTFRHRLEIWDAPVRTIVFVWWPITFYLGWIILATVVNISAFLVSLGYDGTPLGEPIWTVIMLLVATGIYLILTYKRNLREAAMVGAWGFSAVVAAQWNEFPIVAYTALLSAIVLLAAGFYHGYRNRVTSPAAKLARGEWR